jgi:tripartite-type tricarboxylate transporter receptor subunit TctC
MQKHNQTTLRISLSPLSRLACASMIALAAATTAAAAQSWPTRPITMVVPFPAAGAPDIVARFLAEGLSQRLGQRVVVENRSGASGNIGGLSVAKATPDGYTLMLATPYPMGFNKLMTANLKYDPEQDYAPVVLVGKSPQIFVSRPSLPAKNLKEAIDYAAANPGKLIVGIPGIGTTSHIALEYLLNESGTKVTTVTYRGSPPPTDIISGTIDIGVGLVTGYIGMVKSGGLRALGVTSTTRSAHLPDTPTAQELGFPNFEATAWYVLVAPTGTPPEVIEKLNAATNEYMRSDKGKENFLAVDLQAGGGTPADAKAFVASEIAKWGPLIKKVNIKM